MENIDQNRDSALYESLLQSNLEGASSDPIKKIEGHLGDTQPWQTQQDIQKGISSLVGTLYKHQQDIKQLTEHNQLLKSKNGHYLRRYQEFKNRSLRKIHHLQSLVQTQTKQIESLTEQAKNAQAAIAAIVQQKEQQWTKEVQHWSIQCQDLQRKEQATVKHVNRLEALVQELSLAQQDHLVKIAYLQDALNNMVAEEQQWKGKGEVLQRAYLDVKKRLKKVVIEGDLYKKKYQTLSQTWKSAQEKHESLTKRFQDHQMLQAEYVERFHTTEQQNLEFKLRLEELSQANQQHKDSYQRLHELYLKERREKQLLLDKVHRD